MLKEAGDRRQEKLEGFASTGSVSGFERDRRGPVEDDEAHR